MSIGSTTPKTCVVPVIENLVEAKTPGNVSIQIVLYIRWECVKIAI